MPSTIFYLEIPGPAPPLTHKRKSYGLKNNQHLQTALKLAMIVKYSS